MEVGKKKEPRPYSYQWTFRKPERSAARCGGREGVRVGMGSVAESLATSRWRCPVGN